MKLILANHKNQHDINAFSGTSYFMARAIREEFKEVVDYNTFESEAWLNDVAEGDLENNLRPVGLGLSGFLRKNHIEADFVLCQGGNSAVPFYDHHIPVAFWHDSTWHTFLHAYLSRKKFAAFKRDYRNLYLWDRKALDRADIIIFSSEYVAEACIRDYKVGGEKVKVIPFGANIHNDPSPDFLKTALEKRRMSPTLNLTFLGKDWRRKGLPKAYELTLLLNAMGVNTKLNVIGCDPSLNDTIQSPFVNMYGFIDKAEKPQYELLQTILQESHFLVHPAVSEPYGIALCDANAHGIPVIGTDVEGLKTIVSEGMNGFLFNAEDIVKKAAGLLREIFEDFDARYLPLFYSTLNEYSRRLNWRSGARQLNSILSGYN